MNKQYTSIFNNVIGPVMKGPSSSHLAGALRIGKIVRYAIGDRFPKIIVEFDKKQPLALSYHGHGSDIGFASGLLGYEAYDERVEDSLKIIKKGNIELIFQIVDYDSNHPNEYKITAFNNEEKIEIIGISTGGGMIEITKFNNFDISIKGDYYETLIQASIIDKEEINKIINMIKKDTSELEQCNHTLKGNTSFINIKTSSALNKVVLDKIGNIIKDYKIYSIPPVLPIHSYSKAQVPFKRVNEMIEFSDKNNLRLWELAVEYESRRGKISKNEVFKRMKEIHKIMNVSVKTGLDGTEYKNRILGTQSKYINERKDKLIPCELINKIIANVSAVMEVKSSMGTIVASPTAGSCGALPGTLTACGEYLKKDNDEIIRGLLAAGMIGVFISENATFAGEIGGCQVECGAASAMTAAAIVEMFGGSPREAVDAASMALQNMLGSVCDPVADRVEVPCLGKNIMAGVNALSCANMALAGFNKVIPLEETINALYDISLKMPVEFRCTGLAGLSLSKTSKEIYKEINH